MKDNPSRRHLSGMRSARGNTEPADTEALVNKGIAAIQAQDYELARRLLRRASASAPFRQDIKDLLKQALEERPRNLAPQAADEDYEEEIPVAQPVRKTTPPVRNYEARPAVIHVKPRKRKSSMARLILPVLLLIALTSIGAGIYSGVRMHGLKKAKPKQASESPEIKRMIEQAKGYSRNDRYEEAIILLDKARKMSLSTEAVDEAEADVRCRQANLMFEARDYERAIDILETAIQLQPDNPEYLTEKGRSQHFWARHEKDSAKAKSLENDAVETLQKALQIDADNVLALWHIGRAYSTLNDRESAAKHYRHLIQVAPESMQASAATNELERWGMPIEAAPASAAVNP